MALFEPVFSALNAANVRYVVVGGLAVVMHGYPRLTADIDLVVDLAPLEARRAVDALLALGLKARAPEDAIGFAHAETRQRWIDEKGITVFSFYDPKNPLISLDLFVKEPMPFQQLIARSEVFDVGGTSVRIAAIDDLIAMKRSVGRPQDLLDVEALEAIRAKRREGGRG